MPWIRIFIKIGLFACLFAAQISFLHANEHVIYEPKYAQGFRVLLVDGRTEIQVRDLRNLTRPMENFKAGQLFKSLALTSTTQYPMIQMLGLSDQVSAVSGKKYFQILAQKKKVIELGQMPNVEKIKSIPGVLLLAHVDSSDELESLDKMQRLKIPLFKMRDHLELHFLGRAEWMIALGYLLSKEELSKSLFKDIESRYLALAWREAPLKTKVIIASSQGDQWHLKSPAGPFGRILLDAGIVLSEGPNVIQKEKFHELAMKADVCLIEGQPVTMKELRKFNPLVNEWKCSKNKMIFNYDKLLTKSGGNDFWETAVVRPDLLLQEYVTLFHPSLYQPNQLRWYKVIK